MDSIYIRNIDEKIKIPKLKEVLQHRFSKYGQVLDVVAHANIRMRGQAFVIFENTATAEKAMQKSKSAKIFGKPMVNRASLLLDAVPVVLTLFQIDSTIF